MISKKAVIRTAKTRFSDEDGCYVVESVLWENTAGTGDTPAEAFDCFVTLFEMEYEDYLKGQHLKNRTVGRPAKNKTRFYTEIEPELKTEIANLAKNLGISQGEAVEYLYRSWKAQQQKPQSA